MADLRIVDAPEIPTNSITGQEKLPTGGGGNYSITLDSLANYTKTKKDLVDNTAVDSKVNGVRQELDAHIEDLSNPHQVTKGQIGLGNVDNTADLDKPVSNSTQAAIISAVTPKADKTYVDTYLDLAKRGIANRYDSSLTYNSGERVVLTNGDIVKNTLNGNTNNPNVDMTGWVLVNLDSQIKTWSGRTQEEKNKDLVNVKDYGAKCDGITIDNDAVTAMMSVFGHVRFPKGTSKLNTMTLSGHIYFDDGASISVDTGNTITVSADISAPLIQTVFKGNGTYNFTHVGGVGESFENIRFVQAAWFGLYPTNDITVDQAPLMQKISDALGNLREGVVEFMMGNYQMHTGVLWNRGTEVVGAGTRRTVFKIHGDGYTPFSTNNVAVRFRGFQFEFDLATMISRNSPLLQLNHNDCEIHDVGVYPSARCIVINGLNAVLRDIRVTYGTDMSSEPNSCVIYIQKGNCSIDGVRALTSQFSPQYLILVNPNSNTGTINILNVMSALPCPIIGIITDSTFRVSNINADNIQYVNSTAVGSIGSVVHVKSSNVSSSAKIRGLNLTNIICNGTTQNTITLNSQLANIDNVNIDNVNDQRTSGYIVHMQRTNGVIKDIQIGNLAAINIPQPVFASDVSVAYKLSNVSEHDCVNPKTWEVSLNTDSVYTIDLFRNVQTASVEVIANNGASLEYGNFAARFIATPAVATINVSANVVAVYNTTLTGTTGTVGKITVAINDHALQIENRTGVAQNIIATIKSGRW